MSNTDKERKILALILGVMVLGLTVFVTILSQDTNQYLDRLDAIESHAQQAIEDYLGLAKRINGGFLDTIAEDWDGYQRVQSEVDFLAFSRNHITPLMPSAYFSVILTCSGERYYNHNEYAEMDINLNDIPTDRRFTILFGDECNPFGTGNRLYIQGMKLYHGEQMYEVYVGFYEPLMYGNFINALDIDSIGQIKNGLNQTVSYILRMKLFIIIFGFILVYHAMKLKIVVYRDIVNEMGGVPGGKRKTDPPKNKEM